MKQDLDTRSFYYGWIIAVCSCVLLWITNGMLLAGLTVYDEVLLEALQERRGPLKFRDTITLIGSGLLAPVAGALADRLGVRPLMVFGLLLLAAGNFLYSQVGVLGHVYAIHVMFAGVLASAGLVVNVMIVSRWFVRSRGIAIGIALAGTSLGNAALPQLNAWLITEYGWREAFMWTSVIPLLLIPMVLLVMREKPADMGLRPLGADAAARSAPPTGVLSGMDFRDALRTRNFWVLATIAMATFYSILALASHLFLHMRELEFDVQVAATGVSVMFLLGLFGKIGSGFLADLFGRKVILIATLGVMSVGMIMLVNANDLTFWPSLILVGLGWGGVYTLLQLLAADSFGLKDLGKILGTITVLDTLGGGLGPFLTGVMYDHFGSYRIAFIIIAGLVTFALVVATQFRPVAASGRETESSTPDLSAGSRP